MRAVAALVRLVLALVLVVALVVAALTTAITLRAWPQVDGTLRVAGLDGDVRVLRDDAGVARIYADTPHDLFLAQGYVHAQDRMWQMEVWRHISSGRLSELFGRGTLDTDRFVRTLGWRQAAERDLDALSDGPRAALEAYAEGVNAWLDANRGGLSLPFVVTGMRAGTGGLGGYDPEPWTPLDSAAWQKVQAWNLGGNLDEEVFRMLADARLGDPAATDALFPAYRADAPVITPSDRMGAGARGVAAWPEDPPATEAAERLTREQAEGWRAVTGAAARAMAIAGLAPADGLVGDRGLGSNSWVVAPSRSATGGALLANDPHLGIGMPSVWYMNGLHCRQVDASCPFDVAGVSFPGAPAVVLGHNARIAWGATNVDPDVQDLVRVPLDRDDPGRYVDGTASVPLTVRRETIRIAGGGRERLDVRVTRHGPILNDVDERLAEASPMALRWTAIDEPDATFEAIFALNTAATFEAFRAALSAYGAPSQHFVYADVDGHIGYQLAGRVPIRNGAATGSRPVTGADGAAAWQGDVAFEDLPWQLDPDVGWIVTANNAPTDAAYPHRLGDGWDPGYRAARIVARLEAAAADGVTTDDLRAIQLDTVPLRADRLRVGVEALRPEPATDDGRALLDAVRRWSRECTADDRGCAAYHAFEYRLVGAMFEDDLGDLAGDYVGGSASFEAAVDLFGRPDDPWWDDTRTPARRETARDIVVRTLDGTAAELRRAFGGPNDWTWGRMHRATFREETLGTSGIAPLEWYLNRGPVAAPGAPGAVLNTYHRPSRGYPDPTDPDVQPRGLDRLFEVAVLPSYRLTIDLSDLEGARIVQSTGQSGNPFDPHYGDLIDRWATGGTLPLPWSADAVAAAARSTLRLEP